MELNNEKTEFISNEKLIPYEEIWDTTGIDRRMIIYFPMLSEEEESYLKDELINLLAYYKLHKEEIDAVKNTNTEKEISPYYHIIAYWTTYIGMSAKLKAMVSDLKVFRNCVKYFDRTAEKLLSFDIIYQKQLFFKEDFRTEETISELNRLFLLGSPYIQNKIKDVFEKKHLDFEHLSERQAQLTINLLKNTRLREENSFQ